ncbi:replication-relaxation family protein [Nocardia aurantiaca]|uniref:Protein involved in plasmid replication-relaxation n=1 Tax=Nocardia aurantiaca TaxID=2675850 RepID=A0A6I3L7Q5_9NOCA|nr:replication-relaxation family protein [Nocardia aurantiaca]MTE17040.1 hypothetical protein [Nocardia aurantiaca]
MIVHPDRHHDTRAPRSISRTATAALVGRLTGRDHWILRMLHEHRVLTTNQLAALAFPTAKVARRRMALLHRYQVVDRFRPLQARGSAPSHWVLAPAGAAILAAEAAADVRALGYRSEHILTIAHSLHLTHTLGVNEWFTTLTTAHHTPGGSGDAPGVLVAWWSQTRAARLWGDLARPDGYGRYTHTTDTGSPPRVLDFFLEYDLGTTSLRRVAAKLLGYAELARSTGIVTPVLVWVPTRARETHARHALHDTWRHLPDPDTVPVATAAAGLLDPTAARPSPADRVWLPLDRNVSERLHLHELTEVWPARTLPPPASDDEPTLPATGGIVLLPAPPPRCPDM